MQSAVKQLSGLPQAHRPFLLSITCLGSELFEGEVAVVCQGSCLSSSAAGSLVFSHKVPGNAGDEGVSPTYSAEL